MKITKNALKIVGYARESTREQAMNGFNLDDQEKKILNYCNLYYEENNIIVMREEGSSAKSLNRPIFKEITRMIKSKEIDVLVIHNLDRLTRKVKDLSTLLEMFQKYNVELISITERIDTTTPMGRFFVYLIVLIAQWEQDTIGERAKRGVYESASQGNYAKGGPPPFGFKRVREGKKSTLLAIDEVVPVVIEIFDKLASNTYSVKSLVQYLNSNNYLGIKWQKNRIITIINNPIYYGRFEFGKVVIEDYVPALITEDKYIQTQEACKIRRNVMKNKYIFKNMIICKKCNALVSQEPAYKKKKLYKYYFCMKCRTRINEQYVLRELDYTLSELFRSISKAELRERLVKSLKKHETKIREITEAFESDIYDTIEFKKKIKFYHAEIKKIKQYLSETNERRDIIHFSKLPHSEQRKLLKGVIRSFEFDMKEKKLLKINYLGAHKKIKKQ